MRLKALIVLGIIAFILLIINLTFLIYKKVKFKKEYKTNNKNKPRNIKEAKKREKISFWKSILQTKSAKAILVLDGCFYSIILLLIGVFVWIN